MRILNDFGAVSPIGCQSINQSTLFRNITSIYKFCYVIKTKLTRKLVRIAKVQCWSNGDVYICGHFQQCSAILYNQSMWLVSEQDCNVYGVSALVLESV